MESKQYDVYREENGEVIIDLKMIIKDDRINVDEQVSDLHLESLTEEDLYKTLEEKNLSDAVIKEIKKGINNTHMGVLEHKWNHLQAKLNFEELFEELNEETAELKESTKDQYEKIMDTTKEKYTEVKEETNDLKEEVKEETKDLKEEINEEKAELLREINGYKKKLKKEYDEIIKKLDDLV